jgi:hypothetical protein
VVGLTKASGAMSCSSRISFERKGYELVKEDLSFVLSTHERFVAEKYYRYREARYVFR